WYGDANIALSSMFAMTAGYEEHFEDQQLRLARALGDVFNQSGDLPVVPSPVNLNEDLVNLAFYSKDARLGAIFRDDDQEFDLWGTYTRREFTTINDEDESAGVAGRFAQKLPNDFRVDLSGTFSSLIEPRIGEDKTQMYTLSGGFTYAISPDAGAHLEYTW